ncbi:hypothetical protein EZV62_011243 [Acer yangbiense]|uniref:Glycosyltransferase n=1 Tax=Acer yangbiense TaxID=1000413 RepID=A0A5C7I5W8_9ROSI|nr:hypothetical protein EZV62_011243 [Acer yangbiense]
MKEETENEVMKMVDRCIQSEMSSYGVLVNSFHELEPGYSEHYRKIIEKKTWYIDPVSLCTGDTNDKARRGHIASISEHECLRWLDSKQPNSVIYICFGSTMHFSAAKQLFEIAMALEATRQSFIWVVKKEDKDKEEWLPEGFETRMEGRGSTYGFTVKPDSYVIFPIHGHMIPTVDMARLFARHGVKATIRQGLPEACEYVNAITSPEMEINFYKAIGLLQQPFEQLLEELPGLPDQVKLIRQQLSPSVKVEPEKEIVEMMEQGVQAEMTSDSVLVNSFDELEPPYAEHYRKIAMELEVSGQNFIWVVKKEDEDKEEWLPEGFDTRMEGRGLIIRGWAPQVLILDHEAIGGFMTHYGWNSTLESVTAGVPMVTWPLSTEQFYNEKLVTDVLKIGVGVGSQEWSHWTEERRSIVKRDDVNIAVTKLMVGEDAKEMRNRAMELKEMAKRAIEEGGSSYSDLNALLAELKLNCH